MAAAPSSRICFVRKPKRDGSRTRASIALHRLAVWDPLNTIRPQPSGSHGPAFRATMGRVSRTGRVRQSLIVMPFRPPFSAHSRYSVFPHPTGHSVSMTEYLFVVYSESDQELRNKVGAGYSEPGYLLAVDCTVYTRTLLLSIVVSLYVEQLRSRLD
jgi:hypothetical protein